MKTVVLSSLERTTPEFCPETKKIECVEGFRNEAVSFQISYKGQRDRALIVRVKSNVDVKMYDELFVPVYHTRTLGNARIPKPGIFPDILSPRQLNPETCIMTSPWHHVNVPIGDNQFYVYSDCWKSLWFTVNESQKTLDAGEYTVTVEFLDAHKDEEKVHEETVKVKILDEKLPAQKLMYTNWLHCDCISDFHNVEIFSDGFFKILENYVRVAATHGMNMVMLPAFTPPLDTPVGKERMTAQLVKVTYTRGKYKFDFSLMKRYIDVCKRAGAKYFEHSHLFSQWGATAAPKIVATVKGKEKRIFGWDTVASGEEYAAFLKAYLREAKKFLAEEKLSKKVLFHVSDEPADFMLPTYLKALDVIKDELEGYMTGDALSHYEVYEKSSVKYPIVATHMIDTFKGVKDLWAYYTGEQTAEGMSNRLLGTPPEWNRIIGVQMFSYNVKGFLHWAYNFYYGVLSHGLIDPRVDVCGFGPLSAGAGNMVYPTNDGSVMPSIRQKVFFEGINDQRALDLLEKKKGREFCDKLIEKYFGEMSFTKAAKNPTELLNFRHEVNMEIMK